MSFQIHHLATLLTLCIAFITQINCQLQGLGGNVNNHQPATGLAQQGLAQNGANGANANGMNNILAGLGLNQLVQQGIQSGLGYGLGKF